ncbi:uncharacterized protein LOC143914368 [Arctopsyche grandis]|uniref:uncharacterized protein LOC143914368 n=1 Tax=Arctopsyche grandis TaxID=121162 RepID=UPI00406D838F
MKEYGVCVVLIAAFGVILATNLNEEGSFGVRAPNCPIVPPGSDAVTVPNVDDCSTFYICDTNGATLAPCLNGTWFNPTVGVCDWPQNVPEGTCKPPNATLIMDELFEENED